MGRKRKPEEHEAQICLHFHFDRFCHLYLYSVFECLRIYARHRWKDLYRQSLLVWMLEVGTFSDDGSLGLIAPLPAEKMGPHFTRHLTSISFFLEYCFQGQVHGFGDSGAWPQNLKKKKKVARETLLFPFYRWETYAESWIWHSGFSSSKSAFTAIKVPHVNGIGWLTQTTFIRLILNSKDRPSLPSSPFPCQNFVLSSLSFQSPDFLGEGKHYWTELLFLSVDTDFYSNSFYGSYKNSLILSFSLFGEIVWLFAIVNLYCFLLHFVSFLSYILYKYKRKLFFFWSRNCETPSEVNWRTSDLVHWWGRLSEFRAIATIIEPCRSPSSEFLLCLLQIWMQLWSLQRAPRGKSTWPGPTRGLQFIESLHNTLLVTSLSKNK